jgi:hypothetical protein
MTYQKLAGQLLLGPVAAVAMTDCDSSGPTMAPPSAPATPSTSAASAAAQVKAGWHKSFNAKAQAGSSLAPAATTKATRVQTTGPDHAKVTYTILISGQPALRNQTGIAFWHDGTSKVGAASFCGGLTLEDGRKTAGLSASCHAGTS